MTCVCVCECKRRSQSVAWRVCASAREDPSPCVFKLTWRLLPYPTPPIPTLTAQHTFHACATWHERYCSTPTHPPHPHITGMHIVLRVSRDVHGFSHRFTLWASCSWCRMQKYARQACQQLVLCIRIIQPAKGWHGCIMEREASCKRHEKKHLWRGKVPECLRQSGNIISPWLYRSLSAYIRRPLPSLGLGGAAPGITVGVRHGPVPALASKARNLSKFL